MCHTQHDALRRDNAGCGELRSSPNIGRTNAHVPGDVGIEHEKGRGDAAPRDGVVTTTRKGERVEAMGRRDGISVKVLSPTLGRIFTEGKLEQTATRAFSLCVPHVSKDGEMSVHVCLCVCVTSEGYIRESFLIGRCRKQTRLLARKTKFAIGYVQGRNIEYARDSLMSADTNKI